MDPAGIPKTIVSDIGTEVTSSAVLTWCQKTKVDSHYIVPGKPTENGFIEVFNSKLRAECLNAHWFMGLADP